MISLEVVADGYNLQQAWMEVRGGRTAASRHQGAGVDGVTIAGWERARTARLQRLQDDLLSGSYRPSPLHWFDIPRREPGRTRRLGIPTVTDRVAQRAVKRVLEPAWEEIFLSCSHGFRPDRSVYTAVAHVLWHGARGRTWVADADIESYFDTICHDRLLYQVAATVDERLLALIAGWLQVGAASPGRGVAQGAVISPLLANVYLHPFDVAMVQADWALVRYADDWAAMCTTPQEATRALAYASRVLASLDLSLNPDKTGVLPLGPQFRFLGAQFKVTPGGDRWNA